MAFMPQTVSSSYGERNSKLRHAQAPERQLCNSRLHFASQPLRAFSSNMDFYERIDSAFKRLKVNRAQVGRETGMSGQGVTSKLKKKSPVSEHEIAVYCRHARMSRAEALGEGSVVIQDKGEQWVVDLYRRMTPDQRQMWVGVGGQMALPRPDDEPEEDSSQAK